LSDELRDAVIESIKEKKGENVVGLDLRAIEEAVTDCFVICSADSRVQVKAIAEFIQENVQKRTGEKAYHVEGIENMEWVLIDYVDVVAHIFLGNLRQHYGLEEIWSDARMTEYS
jgi:ribosome-associated protein